MSVAEILNELPKLSPEERDLVSARLAEINGTAFHPSLELLRAIEEAEAEPEENCIDIEEARRMMESWSIESSSRGGPSKL